MKPALLRRLGKLAIAAVALTGLIGVAHMPWARSLLMAAGGCPFDLDHVDAAKAEAFRVQQLARHSGAQRERARPALDFSLGETTRDQARSFLAARGAKCVAAREDSVLRCTESLAQLSPKAAPAIDDLFLQFDAQGTLVALDAFRSGTTSDKAMAWLQAQREVLDARVGAATARRGAKDGAELAKTGLGHSALEYRYRGYRAKLSATQFGERGVRIREQYQFLPGAG